MTTFTQLYIQLLTEGLVDDLRKKYVPGKVSESEFNAALDADPTPKKKYLIWLLKNLEYDLVKQEDLYKAEEYILIVEKLRDKKMIDPKFVNPNETKIVMKTDPYDGKQKPVKVPKFSFDEFKNYAIKFKEDEDVQLDSKSDIKEKTKVYEAENWEVFVPKTYEQSCILGKGTEWCTATENTRDYYDDYVESGPLYIFINKHNPREKYQFHESTKQFMDYEDNETFTFIAHSDILEFLKKKFPNFLKNFFDLFIFRLLRLRVKKNFGDILRFIFKHSENFIKFLGDTKLTYSKSDTQKTVLDLKYKKFYFTALHLNKLEFHEGSYLLSKYINNDIIFETLGLKYEKSYYNVSKYKSLPLLTIEVDKLKTIFILNHEYVIFDRSDNNVPVYYNKNEHKKFTTYPWNDSGTNQLLWDFMSEKGLK